MASRQEKEADKIKFIRCNDIVAQVISKKESQIRGRLM